jgi:hypothetical protein
MAATDTHATIEEQLEAVFSVLPVPRLYNEDHLSRSAGRQLRVSVAETGNISGTQRKGNVRCWKPLPSNAVKTVTENASLCGIVIYKM